MVVSCESVYHCILGTTLFVALETATSTIHLKIKYHNTYDEPIMVHVDLARASIIHEMLVTDPTNITLRQERKARKVKISNHICGKMGPRRLTCSFCPHLSEGLAKSLNIHSLMCLPLLSFFLWTRTLILIFDIFRLKKCIASGPCLPHPNFFLWDKQKC